MLNHKSHFLQHKMIYTLSHLRSVIGGNLIHYNTYEIPFVTLTLQLPIVGAILFLNCFSDAKPKYIDLEEQVENLTPERFASFPSKMFFTWFDGLIWKGWKKTLAIEDLWALAFYNRFNSNLIKKITFNWIFMKVFQHCCTLG